MLSKSIAAGLTALILAGAAPAQAQGPDCTDKAFYNFVNKVLLKESKRPDGRLITVVGAMTVAGRPKTARPATKDTLVCRVNIQHTNAYQTNVLRSIVTLKFSPARKPVSAKVQFLPGN